MSDIESIWPQIVEAFGHYGKRLRERPGPARVKQLEKLLLEYTAEELVAAPDGYVRQHKGLEERDGFDPRQYFTFESVYRDSKVEKRIEWGLEGHWVAPRAKNASRYANASEVIVNLDFRQEGVTLSVRDNGGGFDPRQPGPVTQQGGFGLTGMRQRAALMDGELEINQNLMQFIQETPHSLIVYIRPTQTLNLELTD